MNEKFRTIGLDTEDKITEFIDYIDDLEDTEEIKSDVYGFFEEESSYNENHIPAYVVMTKYKGNFQPMMKLTNIISHWHILELSL